MKNTICVPVVQVRVKEETKSFRHAIRTRSTNKNPLFCRRGIFKEISTSDILDSLVFKIGSDGSSIVNSGTNAIDGRLYKSALFSLTLTPLFQKNYFCLQRKLRFVKNNLKRWKRKDKYCCLKTF